MEYQSQNKWIRSLSEGSSWDRTYTMLLSINTNVNQLIKSSFFCLLDTILIVVNLLSLVSSKIVSEIASSISTVKNTLTLYEDSMKGTTNESARTKDIYPQGKYVLASNQGGNRVRVGFDLPDSIWHWLALPFYQYPYVHSRMMYETETGVCHYELTHDSLFYNYYEDCTFADVSTISNLDDVLTFEFMISDDEFRQMEERLHTINQLNVRWSNWFVIDYLLKRNFASLTCSSFISFVLGLGWQQTPRELIDVLLRR